MRQNNQRKEILMEKKIGGSSTINLMRNEMYQEITQFFQNEQMDEICEKLQELNACLQEFHLTDAYLESNMNFILIQLIKLNCPATPICLELVYKIIMNNDKKIVHNLLDNDFLGAMNILLAQEENLEAKIIAVKILTKFVVDSENAAIFFENFQFDMVKFFIEQDFSTELRKESISLLLNLMPKFGPDVYNKLIEIVVNIYTKTEGNERSVILLVAGKLFSKLRPEEIEFLDIPLVNNLQKVLIENTDITIEEKSIEELNSIIAMLFIFISLHKNNLATVDLPLDYFMRVTSIISNSDVKAAFLDHIFFSISGYEGNERSDEEVAAKAEEFIQMGGEEFVSSGLDAAGPVEIIHYIRLLGVLISCFSQQRILEFVKEDWIDKITDLFEESEDNEYTTILTFGIIAQIVLAENVVGSKRTLEKILNAGFMDQVEEWCLNKGQSAAAEYATEFMRIIREQMQE